MKPRSNPFLRHAALAALTLAASASSVFAATPFWNATDGNWDTLSNWWTTTGGPTAVSAIPTAGDTITFNGTGVNGAESIYLNGNRSATSLTFANTGTTTLLGGVSGTPANNSLTLSGGITTSTGAGVVTIGDSAASPTAKVDLLLSANQSFLTATGTTLTLANDVSASSAGLKTITMSGTAGTTNFNGVIGDGSGQLGISVSNSGQTINFNKSNTFTGNFAVNGNATTAIGIGADNAFGTGIWTSNAGSNQSGFVGNYSVNGNYTLNNSAVNFYRAAHNFTGTGSLTITNKLTNVASAAGATITNSLGGGMTFGAVDLSSTAATNGTLTLAGTGNTYIGGVIANGTGTASNLTINNTGITTLANNNSFAGALTLGAGSNVVLGGSNLFTSATTLNTGSTLKLGNANSVQSAGVFSVANGANTTLWLGSDASITNLKFSVTAPTGLTFARVIVDRATAGAAVINQTFDFTGTQGLGQQTDWTFQKGSLVTSGTPIVTFTGTTIFGKNNSGKTSILNPLGVNLSVGNITADGGAVSNVTSTLVLDGTSTGNKLTGIISNGANTGTLATPTTISSSSGNTITVASATGYTVGMAVSGTGIASGSVITNIASSVLTLSQTPSSPSGTLTGSNVNAVAVVKAGSGTWSLSGANTFTGTTTVQGGTLNLDFSAAGAPASNILYNTAAVTYPTLTVASGNLQLTGKGSGGNNVQNVSLLQSSGLNSGKVTVGGGVSGSTVTLQASNLTMNTSSLLDFNGMDANNFINATSATAGVNVRTTTNGYTDFGFVDGSKNIVAAGSNIFNALPTTTGGGTSSSFTLTGNVTRSTASVAFKGIRVTGGNGTLDLGGLQLQTSGGSNSAILYNGSGTYNIINGTLTSNSTGSTELDLYTASGASLSLAATAAMTDNGGILSVLAGGAGTVKVSGSKSYTGVSRILGGIYDIDTLANGSAIISPTFTNTANTATITVSSATGLAIGQNLAGDGMAVGTTIANISGTTITLSANNTITHGSASALNAYTSLTNSSLGASSNAAANLIINGATVKYTGSQVTPATDRSFTIGANGATLDASGTNALTWAPAAALAYAANQNNYLTLTGINAGANTFGGGTGVIADAGQGYTALTKTGSGKWVLAGANTYTGGTYINDGTLGLTGTETVGTSGPLGKSGPIVFGGGTLQYSATNTADYSKRILLSTSAIAIDTNGQAVTFASTIDNSNTGGLTKSGTGSLSLGGVNSYSGITSVTAGTLVINGNQSGATGAVTVGGAGASNTPTLGGVGTIGGATTIAAAGGGAVGTHAPGVTGVNNGVGTQSFSSTLAYGSGSIFEWNLQAASTTDPGVVADSLTGSYDKVVAAGAVTGSAAVFKIVLGGNAFTDAFWSTNKTWTDIFSGAGTPSDLGSIFTSFSGTNVNTDGTVTGNTGHFTFNGSSTLTWSAVPEPTSALAGLLIAAGLLRRKRERKF